MYMQRLFKLEIRSVIGVLSHLGVVNIPLGQHPNLLGYAVSVASGYKASCLGINAAGVIRGWRPLFVEMKWMCTAVVRKNRMRENREIFKKYIVALETPSQTELGVIKCLRESRILAMKETRLGEALVYIFLPLYIHLL
jgi:hypothetical protein